MTTNSSDRGGPTKDTAIESTGGKPAIINCPDCGTQNIQGTDYCVNCNADLRTLDIPVDTWSPAIGPPGDSVAQIAHSDALRVGPTTTIREVIAKLRDAQHGCATVVERDRVVGVFTERDVLNQVTPNRSRMLDMPVAEVMTTDPVVLKESDSILVAINKMGIGGFRHMPMVDDAGALRGIVTGRDVLHFVHQQMTAMNDPGSGTQT